MIDDLPQPRIERGRHGGISPAILVWLVPLLALSVAAWVGWRTVADRGPLVNILFEDASGILANETELRYRDVTVGVVENISFTEGLEHVVVAVRIDKEVADYVDADSSFWIVQPEVTTRGISGLNTVLSGVYIEGNWNSTPDGLVTQFVGLDRAPLAGPGQDGLELTLRARREGGLTANTPILFKGVEVGRVGEPQISADGAYVEAPAIVYAPHDQRITTATRFWDTSGFSFSLGANGAEIDFSSLASLVSGGISFETLVSGGEPPQDGARFEVFPDEATARNSVFERSTSRTISLTLVFDQNVSGLETESPVEFNGIRVGEVTNLTGLVDPERFGDRQVRLAAVVEIETTQLGLDAEATDADVLAFLGDKVDEGIRARLANGSLLTGGLKIELVAIEDAEPAAIDLDADPFPIFPTAAANISDVAATAEGVFKRINDLPVEELLDSAIRFLNAATDLARNEDLNGTPAAIRAILADVGAVTGSDAVQALPADVQGLVTELQGTTAEARNALAEIRQIVGDFRAAGGSAQIVDTLAAAESAAADVSTAIEGVPALLEELQALAADARGIPFAELSARLDALLASAEALVSDEGLAALPADVSATLADARRLSDEIRALVASDGVQTLPAQAGTMLAEAQGAVADLRQVVTEFRDSGGTQQIADTFVAAETAAAEVSAAIEGVPALLEELQALAADARGIPFAELSARLDALLASAEALVSDEGLAALPADVSATLADARALATDLRTLVASQAVQDIPAQTGALLTDLQAAVGDLRRTLAQVEQQGTIERVLAAVDAATAAADDIGAAVEGVPALVADLRGIAGQAGDLPLEDLTRQLTDTLGAVQALLADAETRNIPAAVNTALAELEAILSDIRQGGAIDSANRAFAAAEQAAGSVAAATGDLPTLIRNANAVLAQANATLASLDATSDLSREARQALRDVQRAAEAVASLARTLERRPNSILLGR